MPFMAFTAGWKETVELNNFYKQEHFWLSKNISGGHKAARNCPAEQLFLTDAIYGTLDAIYGIHCWIERNCRAQQLL
jgi:hypothetical protein